MKGKITDVSAAVLIILTVSVVCIRSLNSTDSVEGPSSCKIDYDILEKYYELGFKDGSNGQNRGTSMIPRIDSSSIVGVSTLDSELAHSGVWGKFVRMSRFASIVYVYQSVVELGFDQTTGLFSFGQLAANLQHHTKLWKKFLILLCFYNILTKVHA